MSLNPINLVLVALLSAACAAGPSSTALSSSESVSPEQTTSVPEEFYRVEGASTYAVYGISGDVGEHTLVTPTGFSFAKPSRSGSETLKFRTNIIEPSEIESENWFTAEIETIEFQTESPMEPSATALSIKGRFDVQSIETMDFKQIEKNEALPFWAEQKAQIPVDYLEDPAATVWEWKGLRWFKLDTFQMLFQDEVLLFLADRNYTPGRIRFLMAFEVDGVPHYYLEQYIKARKEYFVLTQHGGEWLAREVRCEQCSP